MPYKNIEDARRRDKRYVQQRAEATGSQAPFVRPMVELKVKVPKHGLRIAVIPDTQVRPGVPLEHLKWGGQYIAKKQPDVIVQIGDFCDMSSLSTHDNPGSLTLEGKRYKTDLEAVDRAMTLLMNEIAKVPGYHPLLVLPLGNHEDRITRTINADKKLEGLISLADLKYESFGWKVFPFLQPISIAGVAFCHYFPSGIMGRPISTARGILTKLHMSAYAGHQQGRDIAYAKRADGKDMTAIISGCLTPDHKVLTSDLRYTELGNLQVGDTVVSIDENAPPRRRRFSTGTVTALAYDSAPVFAVTLKSGKVFKVTQDHQWFVKTGSLYYWKTTDTLRKGTRVPKLLSEWETLSSFDAGWLSGMYDGEGSLYSRKTTGGVVTQLAISQKLGPTQRKIVAVTKELLGYDMSYNETQPGIAQYRIRGGAAEAARVLGSIRPERLLHKFEPEMLGSVLTSEDDLDTVESIIPLGVQEIVRSKIDKGTYIVEGYAHHNSFYQHAEEYLSPFTNNHWRGLYFLHEVKDGSFDEMAVSINYLKRRFA